MGVRVNGRPLWRDSKRRGCQMKGGMERGHQALHLLSLWDNKRKGVCDGEGGGGQSEGWAAGSGNLKLSTC